MPKWLSMIKILRQFTAPDSYFNLNDCSQKRYIIVKDLPLITPSNFSICGRYDLSLSTTNRFLPSSISKRFIEEELVDKKLAVKAQPVIAICQFVRRCTLFGKRDPKYFRISKCRMQQHLFSWIRSLKQIFFFTVVVKDINI